MGFSVFGTIIAALTMLPSITFFVFFPPVNKPTAQVHEPLPLVLLERVGQIACLFLLVVSRNWFDTQDFNVWLALCISCLLAYYGLWIRYVIRGRDYALLYQPLFFIPVPMAVFPAAVFGFAAAWGHSAWLGIAATLFSAGHIPISMINSRSLHSSLSESSAGTKMID